MNPVQAHLALNHIPVLLTFVGFALLAWGMWRKQPQLARTALVFLVISALVSIPVYLTGEPSEEIAEEIAGVGHKEIHEHEDAAKIAFPILLVTGGLALLALILELKKGTAPRWAMAAALLGALVSSAAMMRTAQLGGEIRHPEVHGSVPQPNP